MRSFKGPSFAGALVGPRLLLPLILLALALLSFQPASRAWAAGGGIEVLSARGEVRFPRGFVFEVEAQAPAEIVEVKLYHRSTASRVWTYTYAAIDPSKRVEAQVVLDTSNGGYIPPGVEVEYYFSIRDAAGNVVETPRKTLLYLDPDYHWQTTTVGPILLFWHDQPKAMVESVARRSEEFIHRTEDLLQVRLDKPARGVIYNNRREADRAFPVLSGATTDQNTFYGFAFPSWNVFVGATMNADLIVHETAHLLLDRATSNPLARVPAWVNEGFASYMEPVSLGNTRWPVGDKQSQLIPLRQMGAIPGRTAAIRFFYLKAESVVGYLIETYEAEAFRAFLARLDEGKRIDQALKAVYGFDQDGLEQRWLAGAPKDPPRTSPTCVSLSPCRFSPAAS